MNVAIIPARGGSKRIPRKNVRSFCGQPMIAWSIMAAKEARVFDRIIVTTDSAEIGSIAREWGAETPFDRPAELSDDHTPTAPVVKHALDWLRKEGTEAEYACCIYATAPFVQPGYLKQGLMTIREHGAGSCFSVTTFPFPIFRGLKILEDGQLAMLWPEHEYTRSQDLPETYHDAGQFYWLDVVRFMADSKMYSDDARPVVLPRHLVQDIDTEEDFIRAEFMFRALGQSEEA